MANPHQRATRNVADAGGLDHDRAGAAPGEAHIPVDHVVGDETIVGGAPWHHGRHPGALLERQRADRDRREQARGGGLRLRRYAAVARLMLNALRRTPHGEFSPGEDLSGLAPRITLLRKMDRRVKSGKSLIRMSHRRAR